MAMTANLYTISGLSIELGRDRRTIASALREIRPDGSKGAHRAWYLVTALKALGDKAQSAGNLADERARLAKEQADGHAFKNAQMRGELLPAVDVKHVWSQWVTEIRSAFLALPSRVQQRIAGLSVKDVTIIDDEVRAILTDLANADTPEPTTQGRSAS